MRSKTFRIVCAALPLAVLAGCATQRPACVPDEAVPPVVSYEAVPWSALDGWRADPAQEAWQAFLSSCGPLSKREPQVPRDRWAAVCNAARSMPSPGAAAARSFFERELTPYRIVQADTCNVPDDTGLITGYFEPVLRGARAASAQYVVPLFGTPEDLLTIDLGDLYADLEGRRLRGRLQGKKVIPYYSRAELESGAAPRGKEIVWVDSEIDAFFLQIQGSGRVTLTDGSTIRVGYADQNGHPYRSIGKYLIDQGWLTKEQATTQGLRQWLLSNPQRMRQVLDSNPSFVFFREERITDPAQGPKGALGLSLTPGRSIAVDPRHVPLGAPVFLATTHPMSGAPLQRLMLAQDTGGAINGAVRADYFWGLGPQAGESAGMMRQDGRMWILWPKGAPPPRPR
jgi:membrane-bound lytic murein transglycosylase A